ncbi:MAG TPA: hypothetical protein VKR61_19885 [Bryobacteraceae bacterium]|nr:hypothetical protein [Bryobacteraceae bacterium]
MSRVTVDLESYPDLVAIYLGMRVNPPRGRATLFKFGPRIRASVEAKPDGLLLHENLAEFVRDSGGSGFRHETYLKRGGIEAIYDDIPVPRRAGARASRARQGLRR